MTAWPASRRTVRRIGLVVAVALLSVAATLAAEGRFATVPIQPVVAGTQVGTVTVVGASGKEICIAVSGVADAVCGNLWLTPQDTVPQVGSIIRVWILKVPLAGGLAIEEWVLQPSEARNLGS